MQRLTRDEFFEHLHQLKKPEDDPWPVRTDRKGIKLKRRADEMVWHQIVETIEEECGYRMI